MNPPTETESEAVEPFVAEVGPEGNVGEGSEGQILTVSPHCVELVLQNPCVGPWNNE